MAASCFSVAVQQTAAWSLQSVVCSPQRIYFAFRRSQDDALERFDDLFAVGLRLGEAESQLEGLVVWAIAEREGL